jgi:hypothetical protein
MQRRATGPPTLVALAVAVAALAALDVALGTRAQASYAVIKVALNLGVTIACAAAAAGFKRGDYLWRAWSALTAGYLLLTIGQIGRRWPLPELAKVWLDQGGLALGNLVCTYAIIQFALATRAAGLPPYGPLWRRCIFLAGATLLATLLTSPQILAGWTGVVHGGPLYVGDLVSPACDLINFVVAVPLALTMLSLRGGELAWVYRFLVLETFGWMVNDGAEGLASVVGAPMATRTLMLVGFAVGALGIVAAAWTQRAATRIQAT